MAIGGAPFFSLPGVGFYQSFSRLPESGYPATFSSMHLLLISMGDFGVGFYGWKWQPSPEMARIHEVIMVETGHHELPSILMGGGLDCPDHWAFCCY